MEKKSNGALISSVIIIILIIVGGIFIWMNNKKDKIDNQQTAPVNYGTSDDGSASAEVSSIDQDLSGMDLDGLDEGM